MTTPDSSVAFEADTKSQTVEGGGGESVEELKARIRRMESGEEKSSGESGSEIFNSDGTPYVEETEGAPEISGTKSVMVGETEFRFHPPKSAALVAFGMGASDKRDVQTQIATMRRFLKFSLVEESWETLLDRMMNPDDEFSDSDMADIVGAIADKVKDSPEANAPKNGPRGR